MPCPPLGGGQDTNGEENTAAGGLFHKNATMWAVDTLRGRNVKQSSFIIQ